jgi:hypothetical protein
VADFYAADRQVVAGPDIDALDPGGRDQDALRSAVASLQSPARQVIAVARIAGPPGREADAAEAWAFELTYYFTRGVGEPPAVSYADSIYTVTGLIQTTHPHDQPVSYFTQDEPWQLDFSFQDHRRLTLRELYERRGIWFDGRDHG